MKKITTLFVVLLLAGSNVFANTGWYSDYILLNINNGGQGYYWIGDNTNFGTQFDGTNLGTVNTFVLTGCDMKYWSDTQDRTGGSFSYEIMSADGNTQIVAPVETIWNQTSMGGNDYNGTTTISVNLKLGLSASTTYKVIVWAKSWGSGQGDSYLSNNSANYVATFTTGLGTGVNEKEQPDLSISTKSGSVTARFDGIAQVDLFSINGQLIRSAKVENQFTQALSRGAYLLRVNGQTHKVLVQ